MFLLLVVIRNTNDKLNFHCVCSMKNQWFTNKKYSLIRRRQLCYRHKISRLQQINRHHLKNWERFENIKTKCESVRMIHLNPIFTTFFLSNTHDGIWFSNFYQMKKQPATFQQIVTHVKGRKQNTLVTLGLTSIMLLFL